VLQSLAAGSFEKLSFLAGSLRSLLTKPTRLDRSFRAASLLAVPVVLTAFVSAIQWARIVDQGHIVSEEDFLVDLSPAGYVTAVYVVGFLFAVTQLIALIFFRATVGQFVFGFALVDEAGTPADQPRLLVRWLIAWAIPIFIILSFIDVPDSEGVVVVAFMPWLVGLAIAILRPTRGPHDQLTGCWLVRR
jgi:hypothetical protein